MKTAVILHGNLRTFFMPLREDGCVRTCDRIRSNIVVPNNADLFLATDTTDFYLNGVHYFDERQKDKIKDTSSTMFHDVVQFMDAGKAEDLIRAELNGFFKDIKALEFIPLIDMNTDPKFLLLTKAKADYELVERPDGRVAGSIPERIVNQYYKIQSAYKLLKKYETDNNVHYSLIFRGRFDNLCGHGLLNLLSYDYNQHDIFVPGAPNIPLINDWNAFGTRWSMNLALNLYDQLGSTLAKRLFQCDCKCGFSHFGEKVSCKCGGEMLYEEYTLSSEYHLYNLFKNNNIRYASSCYPMIPYRYR